MQNETKRLYGVLDKHLSDSRQDYIVGNKCTIADIAHWGWISLAGWSGINIDDFPTLKQWEERMWARDAVKKGANVPSPYKMKEILANKEATEKAAAAGRDMVQKGMKADSEANAKRSQGSKV
ncbi:hypothetical protein MBLNU459_g3663t1 [Dothideomycetes sp. NU459]